ncbi:hypothetical protein D3C87_163670 [compost metagenome]
MKKILVINGHPNKGALSGALSENYARGAKESGHEVRLTHLSDLSFDPILRKGYAEIQPLEPDLLRAQEDILWAEHIVVVFPIWWSAVPALLKGFFDRTLLPGFAFKYHKGNPFWDKLLQGRTGRIIFTTDAPWAWNWLINRDPVIHMMKTGVLKFCGITPVGVTQFDRVKDRNPEHIQKYLKKALDLGKRGL